MKNINTIVSLRPGPPKNLGELIFCEIVRYINQSQFGHNFVIFSRLWHKYPLQRFLQIDFANIH